MIFDLGPAYECWHKARPVYLPFLSPVKVTVYLRHFTHGRENNHHVLPARLKDILFHSLEHAK